MPRYYLIIDSPFKFVVSTLLIKSKKGLIALNASFSVSTKSIAITSLSVKLFTKMNCFLRIKSIFECSLSKPLGAVLSA